MSQLQLSLLGTPVVKHGERTLTFSTRKALALLVYLAVEGGTHPRKTLSESFWPELDAEHGRAALRATLLELRKLLERTHGPGERAHLLVERNTLGFDQGSPLILDLRFVESASKQVGRGSSVGIGQISVAGFFQLLTAIGIGALVDQLLKVFPGLGVVLIVSLLLFGLVFSLAYFSLVG